MASAPSLSDCSPAPPLDLQEYDDAFLPWGIQTLPMFASVFTLIFLLFALVCFYLFRDLLGYLTSIWIYPPRTSSRRSTRSEEEGSDHEPAGLDPVVLASFPTIPYDALREGLEGRDGRDCAICLSEFDGKDTVLLVTVCLHAFHPDCIDPWLALHSTCPVCRSDLEKQPDLAALLAVQEAVDATKAESGWGRGGGEEVRRSGAGIHHL